MKIGKSEYYLKLKNLLMIYDFIVKIKSAYFLNILFQRKV